MKELHHPTFNMLQSNGIATSKDYMMTNHIASRTISAPVIDLGHMGPEYIPPPPCLTYETSIHSQINNLEDHPTQELHPDVIIPRQHTSYQLWLQKTPLSTFKQLNNIVIHCDGGANSHIFTDKNIFWKYIAIKSSPKHVSGDEAPV